MLDAVLDAVAAHVAGRPPERGGALLGLRGKPVVTEFLFDAQATTTTSTYKPSRDLTARVKAVELNCALQFKGILHSHPGVLDRPSSQDQYELGVGLQLNPHLGAYLAPIVTLEQAPVDDHELGVAADKISWYVATRDREGGTLVRAQPVNEIPLARHARIIADVLGAEAEPDVFVTDFGGIQMMAARVGLRGGDELLLLTSELYPAFAPLLLLTLRDAPTEQVQLPWRLDLDADDRLLDAIQTVLHGRPPYRRGFGPSPKGPLLTRDPARATAAGWTRIFQSADLPETDATRRLARQRSLAPIDSSARVLVVGAGSVGSVSCELLVRSGVQSVTVVDQDVVVLENLSRAAYDRQDVGKPKVAALHRRLLEVDPRVEVAEVSQRLQDVDTSLIDEWIRRSALVVAATDDLQAQRILNAVAYHYNTPAIFPGLYAGARGGEVVFTKPEETACYLCATATRHQLDSDAVEPAHDYGRISRLAGEIALSPDILHVTTAAVKLALALLADDESDAAAFVRPLIERRMTYLTMSMTPRYWFYPAIFSEVPNQYAYQSVWLIPERDTACPVCGDSAGRRDRHSAAQDPSLEALQELAQKRFRRQREQLDG